MKPVLEVKSDCSQDEDPSPSEEISGGSGWPPGPGPGGPGGWPMDEEGRPIPYDEIEKLDYSSFSSPSK